MWANAFRMLMNAPLMRPIVKPIVRFIVGVIAVPLFRLFLKNVIRLQDLDAELEKDLEQWFRGSLVLLVATRNMETKLFPFLQAFQEKGDWVGMGFRIMLAIGVIEMMPDQELFAIIHPGPPKIDWKRGLRAELREKWQDMLRGFVCQHLNRSSPVFAIMAAIATGWIGWTCYGLALVQYLIIGLVTSKAKAMDVLGEFDRQVAKRRRELVRDFDITEGDAAESAESADAAADSQNGKESTARGVAEPVRAEYESGNPAGGTV